MLLTVNNTVLHGMELMLQQIITEGQILQARIRDKEITPENMNTWQEKLEGAEEWLFLEIGQKASDLYISLLDDEDKEALAKSAGMTVEEMLAADGGIPGQATDVNELLGHLAELSDLLDDFTGGVELEDQTSKDGSLKIVK